MLCKNVSFDVFLIEDIHGQTRQKALVKAANHDWDREIWKAMPVIHWGSHAEAAQ